MKIPFDQKKGWKLDTKYYVANIDFWIASWHTHNSFLTLKDKFIEFGPRIEALMVVFDFDPKLVSFFFLSDHDLIFQNIE